MAPERGAGRTSARSSRTSECAGCVFSVRGGEARQDVGALQQDVGESRV
ncbi:MAG: hypothetical protein QXH42_09995 [Thermoplasmata archaeon]